MTKHTAGDDVNSCPPIRYPDLSAGVPTSLRVVLWVGIFGVLLSIGIYVYWFRYVSILKISFNPSDWAIFGGYLGGVTGPILSFLSFVAVLATIALQTRALRYAYDQCSAAQKTLDLARASYRQEIFEASFYTGIESFERFLRDNHDSIEALQKRVAQISEEALTIQTSTAPSQQVLSGRDRFNLAKRRFETDCFPANVARALVGRLTLILRLVSCTPSLITLDVDIYLSTVRAVAGLFVMSLFAVYLCTSEGKETLCRAEGLFRSTSFLEDISDSIPVSSRPAEAAYWQLVRLCAQDLCNGRDMRSSGHSE